MYPRMVHVCPGCCVTTHMFDRLSPPHSLPHSDRASSSPCPLPNRDPVTFPNLTVIWHGIQSSSFRMTYSCTDGKGTCSEATFSSFCCRSIISRTSDLVLPSSDAAISPCSQSRMSLTRPYAPGNFDSKLMAREMVISALPIALHAASHDATASTDTYRPKSLLLSRSDCFLAVQPPVRSDVRSRRAASAKSSSLISASLTAGT
mmetsp:Transcript_19825/g.43237  ORF Transcript_19825/g.43237 Transcript_19825/m.43237 type:complete len:204 (+) Transcript_19825:263-874(+)